MSGVSALAPGCPPVGTRQKPFVADIGYHYSNTVLTIS